MLASHYAPRKPLHLGNLDHFQQLVENSPQKNSWGILLFQDTLNKKYFEKVTVRELLSQNHDWTEAARNLFNCLRKLDEDANVNQIFAQSPLETSLEGRNSGLSLAILDRLTRAAAPRNTPN